jgi:hypothetical protein
LLVKSPLFQKKPHHIKYASVVEEAKSDDFTVDPCQASEDSSGDPLHPPMHDFKAVSLVILMTDAFGGPTVDGTN